MTAEEKIKEIVKARDEIKRIQETEACRCSGFILQYEGGCTCDKGKKLGVAKRHFNELIEKLEVLEIY